MKAEYVIGLEILCFLLGYFIRDLKSLGAGSQHRRRATRRAAARNNPRNPW